MRYVPTIPEVVAGVILTVLLWLALIIGTPVPPTEGASTIAEGERL